MPLDADDISRLYADNAGALVRFLTRRTLDPHVAVELVAETFAAAVVQRRTCRAQTDEERVAWVYGIARNLLRGWYRDARIERRALERLGLEPPVLATEELERIDQLSGLAELRDAVAAGVASLSESEQRVLQLRVVEECSYPEVAEQLGVSEQSARARLSRAVRALAATLDPDLVARHERG